MWIYVLVSRSMGKTGFEPEILAFFACSLNLAITATALQNAMYTNRRFPFFSEFSCSQRWELYLRDLASGHKNPAFYGGGSDRPAADQHRLQRGLPRSTQLDHDLRHVAAAF